MTNNPTFDFDRFFAIVASGRYSVLYDLPHVEGAKAAVERLRGAAGVPEQAAPIAICRNCGELVEDGEEGNCPFLPVVPPTPETQQ